MVIGDNMGYIVLLAITHLVAFFIGHKMYDRSINKIESTGSFKERYAAGIIKKNREQNKLFKKK
jgi:hypothetical protein